MHLFPHSLHHSFSWDTEPCHHALKGSEKAPCNPAWLHVNAEYSEDLLSSFSSLSHEYSPPLQNNYLFLRCIEGAAFISRAVMSACDALIF